MSLCSDPVTVFVPSAWVKLSFRIAVTILILAVIFHSIHSDQVWRIVQQARPELILVALLMQFFSTSVAAGRWQLLMRNLHFGQSFAFYWRSYFKAMFFNQGLPTSIGGDALRVLDVAGRGFRKRDALYGVILDRITGLAALMLLNVLAYAWDPTLLPEPIFRLVGWLLAGGIVALAGLLLLNRLPWRIADAGSGIIRALLGQLGRALRHNRLLLIVLSLLIPILAMLSFFAAGQALGLPYDLLTYCVIVPPALLLTVIPVSVAGWGVREGALIGLFSLIGADRATVLTLSILYGLLQIVVSLPGFVVYLRGRAAAP